MATASTRLRWIGQAALALATLYLAKVTISAVIAKVGRPGASLDDSYIHFQYARAIAEGHPWRYQAGEPLTSGGTSLLWPTLLAPFYAVGFRGDLILWPAWGFSFAALFGLAHEARMLTSKLTNETVGWGAAALVLSFGGLLWCAASGMEVVPFAWCIARCIRRASEWQEEPAFRTKKRCAELIALAWASALFRPEGALVALFAALALLMWPRLGRRSSRSLSLLAALAVVFTPFALWVTTGQTRSTTTIVKLLVGNPYYQGSELFRAVAANFRTFASVLLNGEIWSAEFVPPGGSTVALMSLPTVAYAGYRKRTTFRASGVLLLAALMVVPCFYLSFLWNRLRYLWPFSTGWLIALCCLAWLLGDLLSLVHERIRNIDGLICGAFIGLFASKLPGVIEDAAQSASGIHRQHVAIGEWAAENLEPSARIGLNDTGAIAYFSSRRTFDVVGLTTRSEAPHWVAGAASRFEHYERVYRQEPEQLPNYFIVYPEWMALEPVLGAPLHEETVLDSTILGGRTKRVYRARYDLLGSGAEPWTHEGKVVDEMDVADLESEAAHQYELLPARENDQHVMVDVEQGRTIVDGGRINRVREAFSLRGKGNAIVSRVYAKATTRLRVKVNTREAIVHTLAKEGFAEIVTTLDDKSEVRNVEILAEGFAFSAYHHWLVEK